MTAVGYVERTGGVQIEVPARPEYLSLVRMLVHTLAQRRDLDDERIEDVVLAVSEAAGGVSGDELTVRWEETPDRLVLEVGGVVANEMSGALVEALVDEVNVGAGTTELVVRCGPWDDG